MAKGREVLEELRRIGAHVRADGDRLILSPASLIPTDLRERAVKAKAEIISLLTEGVDPLVPGELARMAAEAYRRICSGYQDLYRGLQRLRVDRPDLVKAIARVEGDADAVGRDFFAGRATREAVVIALGEVERIYRQAADALRLLESAA